MTRNEQGTARLVKEGKAKFVGTWLFLSSGFLLVSGTVGAYARNIRIGQNKIEYRPDFKFPKDEKQWEEKYEEFKKTKEYYSRGWEVGLEEFKQTYWLLTAGVIGALGSMVTGFVPMFYFLARGYFKKPMKQFALLYTLAIATVGAHGHYMDNMRPGQQEGEPLPPKDPNQVALHYLLVYTVFSITYWQSLKLLAKNPNSVKKLKHYFGSRVLRKHLMITSHTLFALVLLSGYLMAGHNAGRAINTYPKVNGQWFLTKDDIDSSISLPQNFFENKRLIHFTHRTLGTLLLPLAAIQWLLVMRTGLSLKLKFFTTLLVGAITGQLHFGSYMVVKNMDLNSVLYHSGNSFLILGLFLYLIYSTRRPDPKVLKTLAAKFKAKNPEKFEAFTKRYSKQMEKILNPPMEPVI